MVHHAANETIYSNWPALKRFRRRLIAPLFRFSDTGLLGLRKLRTHIVICGYQRSGTTLLLAMMEHALPEAKQFHKEISGWRAATWCWRNHEVMVSKVPRDILKLHQLRNFYRNRRAKIKAIVLVRDPRDMLTSNHTSHARRYFQDLDEWKSLHAAFRAQKDQTDVLVIKYEELVADVPRMQKQIENFTGEKMARPFDEFHQNKKEEFDASALNGIRPVDRKGIGRWRAPEHRERIKEILQQVPDLPAILIELGYETDDSWKQAALAGETAPPNQSADTPTNAAAE
jgi:Sulfotransferase domain